MAGVGRSRIASAPHAICTLRRCSQTAWRWWQGDSIAISTLPRARNCTIRPAGPGRPPAVSTARALITQRRSCPTARCSSRGGLSNGALPTSELYDPTTGTWTVTGSLNTARESHTAALLSNGMVLVAGGYDSNTHVLASAELYDPISGSWTPTGSLNTARTVKNATLLSNGMVVVAGRSTNSGILASAELY